MRIADTDIINAPDQRKNVTIIQNKYRHAQGLYYICLLNIAIFIL